MSEPNDRSEAAAPLHEPPPKAAPETLRLRATPRRIVRFRRGVLIGGAAAGCVAIAGITWLALGDAGIQLAAPQRQTPAPERTSAPPDAVANLPADYGAAPAGVPQLGPPLPGDLGRPMLEQHRELGLAPRPHADTANAAAQAAEAERQRVASQAQQAREAGVMVQTSSRSPTGAAERIAEMLTPAGADAPRENPERPRGSDPQSRKIDFVNETARGDVRNSHRLEQAASPHQVMAGSTIAASLITGVNSDLPGVVVAQVTEHVYDTVTGHTLLIPQGSRLIGRYDSVVAFGQSRALLVWQRLILPNGASIQIDNMPATDAAGYAGLEDRVDYHTWRLLRGIGLATLLGVGTELAIDDESDLVRAMRESAQQNASQAGQQIVQRNLDIQPTIRIRPGWPVRVIVHKDLTLAPWES